MRFKHVRLGEVLELQRRQVTVEPSAQYVEIGLRSFGRGVFHKKPVTGHDLGSKRVFSIRFGDLLVSNVFGWEGAVAVASEADDGLIGSHRFMTWAPRTADVDTVYLAHYLLSDDGMEFLRRSSPGSAGRNRTLSIKSFENISAPLPSIDDQSRIAERLDRFSTVGESRSSNKSRSDVVQTLWNELSFGEPVPLGHLLVRRQEAEIVDRKGAYAFLGMRWYGGGPFLRENLDGTDVRAKQVFRVRTGDVLYNRLFAWKGSFGVIDSSLDGAVVSNEFPTFSVNRRSIHPDYLRLCLEQPSFWTAAEELSTGSTPTSRNRLKEEQFLSMTIRVPEPEAQERAIARADLLRAIAERRRQADALAAALLPAARNEVFSQLR